MLTNKNDDPLIAEIEKVIANLKEAQKANRDDKEFQFGASMTILNLYNVRGSVIADRARQQEEKEKMIAELKALEPYFDEGEGWEIPAALDKNQVIAIIQDKEQKEEKGNVFTINVKGKTLHAALEKKCKSCGKRNGDHQDKHWVGFERTLTVWCKKEDAT